MIQYLEINIIKEMKGLYTKRDNILMKEIEEDTNKWKDTHVHESEELILLECSYYPKPSIDSMQSSLNFQ